MSTSAVVMLIVAIVVVWGGLAASVVALSRRPDKPDEADTGG